MSKIRPCLWFDDNLEEALTFYPTVFRNVKVGQVTRYGEAGPGKPGTAMTATFEIEGQPFMALNGGPTFGFTEAVSFVVSCDTQEELDELWDKLTADGGEPSQCGWLKDRFGLSWQVVPTVLPRLLSGDPSRSQRVMQALLQMKKLDIATLTRAAEGS